MSMFLVAACTKHAKDRYLDIPVATITAFKPTAGSVYQAGDSVSIKALAIASAVMHGCDVAIKKGNDSTTYFFKHIHDHNDTIMLNEQWKVNVNAPVKLEVELTFYLDHDGHTAVKRVPFMIE
jgi:hypothetical protein